MTDFSWNVPNELSANRCKSNAGLRSDAWPVVRASLMFRGTPQPRLSSAHSVHPTQLHAVSIEQAEGPNLLPVPPSRRLGETAELFLPASRDGLVQKREQAPVEALHRTGTHRQALGLHLHFEVELHPRLRFGAQHGLQLRGEVPEHGLAF